MLADCLGCIASLDDVLGEVERVQGLIAAGEGNCKTSYMVRHSLRSVAFSFDVTIPGDVNKRDPERENWPCRVMLPILPIQSISGSRLLPSPGTLLLSESHRTEVMKDRSYINVF